MSRPSNPEPVVVMSLRMPASMIKMIDERMMRLKSTAPGMNLTRADVVRNLLIQAMQMNEDPMLRILATPPPASTRTRFTTDEIRKFVEEDDAATDTDAKR